MQRKRLNNFRIDPYIEAALREDITNEDITSAAIYGNGKLAEICLYAKEKGILAGSQVFCRTFQLVNPSIEFKIFKEDGETVEPGDEVMKIRGFVSDLLTAERTALNFLQRISGIATETRRCIEELNDPDIRISDTRKTTPNMRIFEKYGVWAGGGCNHRYNLSDGFLIKDNHIDAAGGIKEAVNAAREYIPFAKKIEVETENLEMVEEALDAGAEIIMLDNMDMVTVEKAVKLIGHRAIVECSGNIDISNIARYRGSGVDYLSIGSLTHSFRSLDFSLKNLVYV